MKFVLFKAKLNGKIMAEDYKANEPYGLWSQILVIIEI